MVTSLQTSTRLIGAHLKKHWMRMDLDYWQNVSNIIFFLTDIQLRVWRFVRFGGMLHALFDCIPQLWLPHPPEEWFRTLFIPCVLRQRFEESLSHVCSQSQKCYRKISFEGGKILAKQKCKNASLRCAQFYQVLIRRFLPFHLSNRGELLQRKEMVQDSGVCPDQS